METLTGRQAEVLAFIREYIESHGYSPSVRDVAAHFGWAINGAVCHLTALKAKGAITRDVSVARSIRIVEQALDAITVSCTETRSCVLSKIE